MQFFPSSGSYIAVSDRIDYLVIIMTIGANFLKLPKSVLSLWFENAHVLCEIVYFLSITRYVSKGNIILAFHKADAVLFSSPLNLTVENFKILLQMNNTRQAVEMRAND